MKDNFDLKKYLVENKTIEKYNPFTTEKEKETLSEGTSPLYANEQITSNRNGMYELREKIREMIISELSEGDIEEDIDEAKKKSSKKDKEPEEETEEVETEETEEETTEEEPAAEEGGEDIEDESTDIEGPEGELKNHLKSALTISTEMDNETLTNQIENTLKFYEKVLKNQI